MVDQVSLGMSTSNGQNPLPYMFMNSRSQIISHSMWNLTEGHPEATTGIINGSILHSLCIYLQIPLTNTRSLTWYNRIMKLKEILQILSHLLKVTSLLKNITGTRSQVIQSLPSSYFTAHWLWWQSFKKTGPYAPIKSFLFLSTIMTKSSQTQPCRETQQILPWEGPIFAQLFAAGGWQRPNMPSYSHSSRRLFRLTFYWH